MKKRKISVPKLIYPDIYQIRLPIPGKNPGPVNVYLLTKSPITLIDTGMPRTIDILEQSLSPLNIKFSDIEQLVITHGHIDHVGAAYLIRKRAKKDIPILVHKEDSKLIESRFELPMNSVYTFFKLMGLPVKYRIILVIVFYLFSLSKKTCSVNKILEDGDKIIIGNYTGTIISTPGHTKGSICIYLEKEGILFSGDHIISHITPNAFVMLESNLELPDRSSQSEFYQSVIKIENINPKMVFSGHGKDITDLFKITNMYKEKFTERQQKIVSILNKNQLNVFQIATHLFPEEITGKRFIFEIYLCISEVYTHLQVLESENRVNSERTGNGIIYSLKI